MGGHAGQVLRAAFVQRAVRRVAGEQHAGQPEHVAGVGGGVTGVALDAGLQQAVQGAPVDAVEEVAYVQLQVVARWLAARKGLQALHSGVGTLAFAVGVAVVDEDALEQALEPRHQQVVHHAVAKVCRQDFTRLGVQGDETGGAGGVPGVGLQCLAGVHQPVEQVDFVPLGFARAPFAPPAGLPGLVQRRKAEHRGARVITLRRARGERGCCCYGCCCWRCHC